MQRVELEMIGDDFKSFGDLLRYIGNEISRLSGTYDNTKIPVKTPTIAKSLLSMNGDQLSALARMIAPIEEYHGYKVTIGIEERAKRYPYFMFNRIYRPDDDPEGDIEPGAELEENRKPVAMAVAA